jgi:hypothetical protein
MTKEFIWIVRFCSVKFSAPLQKIENSKRQTIFSDQHVLHTGHSRIFIVYYCYVVLLEYYAKGFVFLSPDTTGVVTRSCIKP